MPGGFVIKSNEFSPSVFQDITEGHLQDRKRDLPKIDTPKGLKDFLIDVIALANSARLRGRDSFLIYGVDNDRHIVGIAGQDIIEPVRTLAMQGTVQDVEKFQGELVGRELLRLIEKYVGDFFARYEFGYVNGLLVSYLVLPGRTPEQWHEKPYQISKDVRTKKSRDIILGEGGCWMRKGESNDEVLEADKASLYCHSVMPHIATSQWLILSRHFYSHTADFPVRRIPVHGEINRHTDASEQMAESLILLRLDYFVRDQTSKDQGIAS